MSETDFREATDRIERDLKDNHAMAKQEDRGQIVEAARRPDGSGVSS